MIEKRLKSFFTAALVILVLGAASCGPPSQDDAVADQCRDANVNLVALTDQQYTGSIQAVDDIMEDYLGPSPPGNPRGCALGVVVDNEVYYLKGYGFANLGNEVPYTYATPQGIGSISKTITALAILKLVEQGSIDLDDNVSQHIPQSLTAWSGITIRQLLSHSSGLPGWPTWESWLNTEEELQQSFPGDHPGIHPRYAYWGYAFNTLPGDLVPGSGLYSNTGYALLGVVIDHVTNQPDFEGRRGYETYTWWNVAATGPPMPTLCLDTYWREDDILNLATGYQHDSDAVYPNTVNPNSGPGGWRGPPGGWSMTIGDLARLMIGINTNTKVASELKQEMLNTNVSPPTGEHTYGLGLWNITNLDRPTFMHGGNIDGFTARYTMWPDENFGVALMCNREEADGFRQLTNDIAALFLDSPSIPTVSRPGLEQGLALSSEDVADAARLWAMLNYQTGDMDAAAREGTRRLLRTQNGKRLLRALKAGNSKETARLLRYLLAEMRRAGPQPSPVLDGLNEIP